jgi:hypothetical protein
MRLATVILVFFLGGEAVKAQVDQIDANPLPLLVNLDGERLGDGVQAYANTEAVWLPIRRLATLLEIPTQNDARKRAISGWLFQRDRQWFVDLDNRRMVSAGGDDERRIDRNAFIAPRRGTRPEVHVRAEVIEYLWPLKVEISRADLTVRLRAQQPIPRQRRKARQARQSELNQTTERPQRPTAPQIGTRYQWWQPPGGTAQVSVSSDESGLIGYRGQMTAVGEITGTTAFATASASRQGNERLALDDARLTLKRFASPQPMALGIREIAAGDISLSPSPRVNTGTSGVGIAIDTSPLRDTTTFDDYTLEDDAAPGSDVELYQDGDLVALTEADERGRYQFDGITIDPGVNPLRVVIRQPDGQQITRRFRPVIGRNQIPAGNQRLRVEAVRPGQLLIDRQQPREGDEQALGAIDFRFGLRDQTTARFKLMRARGAEPSARADYLRTALLQGWGPLQSRLTVLNNLGRGTLYGAALQFPQKQWPLTGEIALNNGLQSPDVGFGGNALERDINIRTRGTIRFFDYPVRFRLRGSEVRRVDQTLQRTVSSRQSGRIGGLRWRNRIQWSAQEDRIDGSVAFSDWLNINARQRLRWSGQLDYQPSAGLQRVSLSTRLRLGRRRSVNATLNADPQSATHRAALSVTGEVVGGRYTLGADLGNDGNYSVRAAWRFYFADRRDKPPAILATNPAGRGRMHVRVYLDRNRNGRRDATDSPLQNVRLQTPLGGKGETDADGELVIAGLTPHRHYPTRIDPASLDNPLHRPRGEGHRVWVRPGSTPQVEIPVERTGAIYGHTRFADERQGAEGIPLRLVDCQGDVVARRNTRYNGFFAFEGLPFQQHWLRVDNQSGFRMVEKPRQSLRLNMDQPYESEEEIAVAQRSTLDESGAIQGTVIAPDCAGGLGGVDLKITAINRGDLSYHVTTGPDGHFQHDRLPFGRYRITVMPETLPTDIAANGPDEFELTQNGPLQTDYHIQTKTRSP